MYCKECSATSLRRAVAGKVLGAMIGVAFSASIYAMVEPTPPARFLYALTAWYVAVGAIIALAESPMQAMPLPLPMWFYAATLGASMTLIADWLAFIEMKAVVHVFVTKMGLPNVMDTPYALLIDGSVAGLLIYALLPFVADKLPSKSSKGGKKH